MPNLKQQPSVQLQPVLFQGHILQDAPAMRRLSPPPPPPSLCATPVTLYIICPPVIWHITHCCSVFACPAARVTCITTNGKIALSGCSQGSLHLWRMSDGQLADTAAAEAAGTAVTAVECLGPLMVSNGMETLL
jgi:hypothetical protein